MIELLTTKLFIPRPRKNRVSRSRLVDRLNPGLDRKLTLIAAPAGFGKTTLLSEWIPKSPHCVTWLSLDEGDNDPVNFWAYFISSLQGLQPEIGRSILSVLQSPQPPPITSILTGLINDITAFKDVFAIVLDDYHVIDTQTIHEGLTFLIDHLPGNMHLVMTTRVDPPLPLARIRAHDDLTELRAIDLRFTLDETVEFLNRVMRLSLSAEEISVLETRTEGWIAGLQIAALSMQDHKNISGFIRSFSGSHRHVLGYLAEEVLNQQPNEVLNFLLQTSILDRLCGPLCDAVTDGSDGQAILENLAQANLFIMPLDDEGIWYRYHQLFAEVLQARLEQTNRDLVANLHHRAGGWYEKKGMIEEAVRHTLAGTDFDEAARLIEAVAGDMLRRGSSASVMRWFESMPEDLIRARPHLCLARGWTFFFGAGLNLEIADELAQLASQSAAEDELLRGEAAALQAMIAVTRGELARCRELFQQALDALPLDSPWRNAVTFGLGTAHLESGNMALAAEALSEAMQLSEANGDYYIQFAAASFLGDLRVFEGHLSRAMEIYQQVLALADPNIPQKGEVMAHGGLAQILWERDQLDAALAQIQLGTDQIDRVGGVWSAFVIYRVLARVRLAQGRWNSALDILSQARQRGEESQVRLVVTMAAALSARLQLAQDDLEAATVWAENSGLSPDDGEVEHPGWREVEYLTLARVLNAQGRQADAMSLLDRLLRSAQAEERFGSVISILVLQCLIMQNKGNTTDALMLLDRAMLLGEPEGYVRIFIDEGESMRLLLLDFQSTLKKNIRNGADSESFRLLTYTDKLLAAFSQPAPIANPKLETLSENLSERELDILRFIAAGDSNLEIAEHLVLAQSTVKWYINSLYSKLGARSRTHALARAIELELI